MADETFHTPMGTATQTRKCYPCRAAGKHFIPLWGQQRQDLIADISANTGNISYPYGDSNVPL